MLSSSPAQRRLRAFAAALGALVLLLGLLAGSASAATSEPVDVLLLFDTTGSMEGALSEAQAEVSAAATEIRTQLPDAAFGVAETRDYLTYDSDEDRPWRLLQPITTDVAQVNLAIDGLAASGGGDDPEAYASALSQAVRSPTVGWRPGARRLIVMVADNLPHDADVNEGIDPSLWAEPSPFDTGIDPGPDGTVGTTDDVDWQATLSELALDGVPLMFVFYHGAPIYLPYWQAWAGSTGGLAEEAGTADLGPKLVALAAAGATGRLTPCPSGESRDSDGRCVPLDVLAEHYRPWLLFDSGEHWRPLEIGAFLAEPGLKECIDRRLRRDPCIENPAADQLAGTHDGDDYDVDNAFLNLRKLDGQYRSPVCSSGIVYDCEEGPRSVLYYHAWQSGAWLYLDYWWYLRFNQFQIRDVSVEDHQGDWEGITVTIAHGSRDRLFDVAFGQHGHYWRYLARNLGPGDSPHTSVYVARGSHASYPFPCLLLCVQTSGNAYLNGLSIAPDKPADGRVAWGNNPDAACAAAICVRPMSTSSPLDAAPPLQGSSWTGWKGIWGRGGPRLEPDGLLLSGPRSPGQQDHFHRPDRAGTTPRSATARSASEGGTPVCDDSWSGPFVVAAACDPHTLAENGAEVDGAPTLSLAGALDGVAAVPGLVQALGDPLKAGATLTLTGTASAATTLDVRVAGIDGSTATVRVGALQLTHGGTVTLTARRDRRGRPALTVRTPKHRRPRRIGVPSPPPPGALGLRAVRRGGSVRVTFATTRSAAARIELTGTQHGPRLAARTIHVSPRGKAPRVSLRAADGSRFVRVTLVRHGRSSRAATAKIAGAGAKRRGG